MEKIDVIKDYHDKIVKVWKIVENEFEEILKEEPKPKSKEVCSRAFAQDTLYKNGLLFLGIGASFRKGYKKTCNLEHKHVQYEKDVGRNSYPYYRKMINLAEETGFGNNWSNIDITLFRTANQDVLEYFFKEAPKIIEKQLDLAIDMIIATNPKIIIVSNAFVRDVFKKERKDLNIESCFKSHFDDHYGTEIIDTPKELKGKPIFFTSMLSGVRALDLGSLERLSWHIKHVKKLLE
jgi:hypothetical protein